MWGSISYRIESNPASFLKQLDTLGPTVALDALASTKHPRGLGFPRMISNGKGAGALTAMREGSIISDCQSGSLGSQMIPLPAHPEKHVPRHSKVETPDYFRHPPQPLHFLVPTH